MLRRELSVEDGTATLIMMQIFSFRSLVFRTHIVCLLLALAILVGCDKGLKTYSASGFVHFPDGSALPGGNVIFQSADSGIQARAKIQEDGTFVLGTESLKDGAIEGRFKVSVRPKQEGPAMGTSHPIHRKFHSVRTSGLEFTVTPDGENYFDIKVEPPADPTTTQQAFDLDL